MSEADPWLTDYGHSHSNVSIPVLYWPSVLILGPGVVGLLWSLPVPDEFVAISPILNWGTAFLMAAVVYYFIISISLAIGMLPFVVGVAVAEIWLANSQWPVRRVSAVLVTIAIVGLAVGQIPNGSLRKVLRDIQLLMIGPVWLLSNLYRRLGIPF